MAKPKKPEAAAAAAPAAPVRTNRNDLPWERYEAESAAADEALAAGLESLAEPGENEVLISTIEDMGRGQVKLTHRRLPGDHGGVADLRESADGMLKVVKNGRKLRTHRDLREAAAADFAPRTAKVREDAFAGGSDEGGRVVFAADAFYYILLTDDMKYRAMQQSYKMFREDPIYRAVILNLVNYIMGGGMKFHANDENRAVNDYLQECWRINKMPGKDREVVIRHLLTGEIAIRFYKKGENGVAAKYPSLRLIPFWRLAEVMKDQDDAEVITGFKVWQASGPYRPMVKVEDLKPEELMFWKNSTPEEDRGEPPLLAAMKPCKWYADWMSNRVMLNRFRTAIVLFKKIIGGTPGRTGAVSSNDPAATNHTGLGGKIEKRLPKSGTVVTHNDKIEYDWKSPQLGAADAGEDGRKILLYVAAAAVVPEFVLGDASNANYASTFVAENPFIRSIEAWQKYFEMVFGELFRRMIEDAIAAGTLPKTSTDTTVSELAWPVRKLNQLLRGLGVKEAATVDGDGNAKVQRSVPTRTDVTIEWPNLLHKNALEDAQVAQIHQGMGLASKQTLRGKMGYDHEVEVDRLAEEHDQDMDQFEQQRQAELDAADAAGGDDDPQAPAKGARRKFKGKPAGGTADSGVGGVGKP